VDEEQLGLFVRVTARLSAIGFLAGLGLFAARFPGKVGGAIRLLISFLVLHTIHFGGVAWLAVLTAGENIAERGGWPVTMTVGAAFYLSAFAILRMWRGVASARPVSRLERLAAQLGVLFIAAIFLNSYASRVAARPVYWLWIAGLVSVVIAYMARTTPILGRPDLSEARWAEAGSQRPGRR
jgi:hypothetical protein